MSDTSLAPLPHAAPEGSTTRLEAFSDGVFAIAITLLVLEIRLPPETEIEHLGGLAAALLGLWPSYAGYAISFAIYDRSTCFPVSSNISLRLTASGTSGVPRPRATCRSRRCRRPSAAWSASLGYRWSCAAGGSRA